jgi:hypothetical protein
MMTTPPPPRCRVLAGALT